MAARSKTLCEQCGAKDDHPKSHIFGGRTVHFDCLSVTEVEQVTSDSERTKEIIQARKDGARGADLLAFITKGA